MSPEQWVSAGMLFVAVIGAATAWHQARNARRSGVSTNELTARRDTETTQLGLIEQLILRLAASELLSEKRNARATAAECENMALREHILTLDAHIWSRKEPPPPPYRGTPGVGG